MLSSQKIKHYSITLVAILVMVNKSFSQFLSEEQIKCTTTTAISISDSSGELAWSPILPYIRDKRLILIGEPNHGAKEFFELRNSFIKYLHQNVGIKVILFESGIGELFVPSQIKNKIPHGVFFEGLIGPWQTRESFELIEYVGTKNISISGFDVQRSGTTFHKNLIQLSQNIGIDTNLVNTLEVRYGMIANRLASREAKYELLEVETRSLILDYQKAQKEFLKRLSRANNSNVSFVNQVLTNRIKFLTYSIEFLKDKDWNKKWNSRDAAMADNIQWLLDNVYKNQQVIIVGHNFHLSKDNESLTTMTMILKAKHGESMYSIGGMVGDGSYSDNYGNEVKVLPPDSTALDVKHVISHLSGNINFMDSKELSSTGCDWVHQKITVNDTFIDLMRSNKMILSKSFDGMIFLKKISPAKQGM
jgi:erythromycin esterase